MNRRYNARIAAILQRRFGGDLDEWRRVQAESFEWYLARGAELDRRDGAEREGDAWVRAVTDLNADQLRLVLEWMGCDIPANLALLSEQFEEETVRGIDATFPDAKPALAAMRDAGHRLFLSTNANRTNAESALIGGGIRDAFDGLLMLETARAKKDRPYYWQNAFALAGCDPGDAYVVDDVASYLRPAEAMGARCTQIIRPGLPRERSTFPVIETLAALPARLH